MNKKDKTICIIVFVVWIALTFTIGVFHEPWADEAQAWLIARDNTFSGIFDGVLRYEGHPFLWFIILRTLYLLHFPYDALFLIPLVLSATGVYLFMFKSKLPLWIKCLFPFTFYLGYQYSVIARNHSMFFPFLSILAVLYPSRIQKPIRYALVLSLLFLTSAYAYVIAGVLFTFFLFDIIQSGKIKQNLPKYILPIAIVTFIAFYVLIYHQKPDDFYSDFANLKWIIPVHIMLKTLAAGYFNLSRYPDIYFQILAVVILYVSAFLFFCKTSKQRIFFFLLNFSLIYLCSALFSNVWHSGYFIITFIFSLWILLIENGDLISFKRKEVEEGKLYNIPDLKRQVFVIFLLYIFLVQLWWSVQCYFLDIKYPYSASKELALYIKENNLEKYGISGFGYRIVSLQPYFNQNIFTNNTTTYWIWNKTQHYNILERGRFLSPVVVVDRIQYKHYKPLLDQLKKYGYKERLFEGFLCSKGEVKEPTYLFLYVKEDILKQ